MLAAFRVDLFVSLLNLKRVNTEAGAGLVLTELAFAPHSQGNSLLILKGTRCSFSRELAAHPATSERELGVEVEVAKSAAS